LLTVFIFVNCEEKGCYRIVSLGHQNFDCRSYCGLSRRMQGKRRAIGACTHSPKSPMSASKIWAQSGDWWIEIIHDVILVFTSGIDKNQNCGKERRSSSKGFRAFIKLLEV